MVTLLLDSAQLEVVLTPWERALSFHAGSLRIERSHIAKVQLTEDPWTWLRGVPSPGTHVPGVVAMGTWRSAGGTDFVIVRRKRSAVVIDLEPEAMEGQEYQRVVLSTRHGLALVQALQLETDARPAEVSDIVTGAVPVRRPVPRRRPAPRPSPA